LSEPDLELQPVLFVPFREFPTVPLLASRGRGNVCKRREDNGDAEKLPDTDAGAKLALQSPKLGGLEQLERGLDRL
jgi:hypothetical protein